MPRAKKDNVESISKEQYSALYSELLKVREELQALNNNKRGFDHTSIPEQEDIQNQFEPLPQPESLPEPEPQPEPQSQPDPQSQPEPEPQPEPQSQPEPEPQPEPQSQPEPEPNPEPQPDIKIEEIALLPAVQSTPSYAPTVSLEEYMKIYTNYVKVKEENLKLRSKLITLEETLNNKTTKKKKIEGENLKNAVIDIILNSNLNIESIPDEVEREIYYFILTQVSNSTSFLKRMFLCA
jgi:outer membrane biosynthesis protein TonB